MDDVWTAVRDDRLALADLLEGLTDDQWAAPSLCAGWSVKDVAAHVAPTTGGGMGTFVLALLLSRLDPDRASRRVVRGTADVPAGEVVADLRAHAGQRRSPPGLGPVSQLADVLVHTLDIAVPLGIEVDRPAEHWDEVLTWLTGPQARRGFVHGPLPEVTLVTATGRWGRGPEVSGPAPALALTLCGRDALLDRLSGPGLEEVTRWVRRTARAE